MRKHHAADIGLPAPTPAARLTIKETARRLAIGENEVYRGIDDGVLPGIKVGGQYVVYEAWVDAFLRGEPGMWHPRTVEATAEKAATTLTQTPSPFIHRRQLPA